MTKHKSPAVESMRREQAQQRSKSAKGQLDKGLEDSFPASHPVSTTSTAIPSGRTDADAARQREEEPINRRLDNRYGRRQHRHESRLKRSIPDVWLQPD